MNHNGYHYKNNGGVHKGVRYLKCCTKYCKGSAKILACGTIVEIVKHNHDRNEINNEILIKTFRNVLKDRSKNESTRLRTIYDEEIIRNETAAMLYPWPVAQISMRKARLKVVPALPPSLNELANFLDHNVERFTCCEQPFFQDRVVDAHGKYSVIFACNKLIRTAVQNGGNELHADATFKVVPSTPQSRQLFIMHLIIQNHSIPVLYALMEAKTQSAYTVLLTKCKQLFPFLTPVSVMTDFETGLHNAFKSVYPNTELHSCWFHYVQALVKNIRKKGLSHFVKINVNAQLCIRMFAALALLPSNKIDEGYNIIRQYARDHNIFMTMAPFFNYFRRYWLETQMAGDYLFSVHGLARRTNNNVESFHGRLKEKFQVMHPNLWTFLTHLNDLSRRYHIIIMQLIQGRPVTRPIKIKYIANSERIKMASFQLQLGTITILEFLLQCSHTAETYIQRELNWQVNVLGDVMNESEDDDDQEITIDINNDINDQNLSQEQPTIEFQDDENDYVLPEDDFIEIVYI